MGYKIVCLHCRKIGNRPFSPTVNESEELCSDCGQPTVRLTHRFRPPKKTDDKKWATVKFLITNGFYYQHIYEIDEITKSKCLVKYPEDLREAKLFVKKYKSQVLKENLGSGTS